MREKIPLWRMVLLICLLAVALGLLLWLLFGNSSKNTLVTAPSPIVTPTSTATATSSTSTAITIPVPVPPPIAVPLPIPIKISPKDALAYKFGISTGDTLPNLDDQALASELNDIASLGVGWVRIDLAWNDVQPNDAADYSWSNLDRVVAAANARNIKILPVLAYTPAWARSSACSGTSDCPPSDPALFAVFVKAAVARYAPEGITSWEIWNEPNSAGFWQPTPNPVAYTALLKAAYVAIKSEEPSSTVVTGGLSPDATTNGNYSPVDFLTQLYADGAKGYFDAVGDHPYSYPALPLYVQSWNAWSQMGSTNVSLRDVMNENGDTAKKIWMTEYGAPTGGPGLLAVSGTTTNYGGHPDHVSQALQAQMMAQAVITAEGLPWAGPLFWYSYKDLGTNTNTNENFFGILNYDGSMKPAYMVLKDLLQ